MHWHCCALDSEALHSVNVVVGRGWLLQNSKPHAYLSPALLHDRNDLEKRDGKVLKKHTEADV